MKTAPALALTAFLVVAFAVVALYIPPDPMNEAFRSATFVLCGWGIGRWGPAGVRMYRDGARSNAAWGILGIVLFLVAEALQSEYTVIFLRLDRPDVMSALHLSAFLAYLKLISLTLFIAATRFEGEVPSRIGRISTAIIAFCGLMFTAAGPGLIAQAYGALRQAIGIIPSP